MESTDIREFEVVLRRKSTGSIVRVEVLAYNTILNAEVEAKRQEKFLPGFSYIRIKGI